MVVRNFLRNNFFFGLAPTSQKQWFSGILARFGLAHLEKFRAQAKNRKTQFPGARGIFWGGDPAAPKLSPQNCAFFFHFMFWPTGPPGVGNRKILVF